MALNSDSIQPNGGLENLLTMLDLHRPIAVVGVCSNNYLGILMTVVGNVMQEQTELLLQSRIVDLQKTLPDLFFLNIEFHPDILRRCQHTELLFDFFTDIELLNERMKGLPV